VAQGHPQGAAGGQDHQGGGGVLQGEQRAGVGAGGLVQSGALGRAGPCGLRCPPGLRVGAGAAGPDAHHVDACGLPGPGDAVGRARVTVTGGCHSRWASGAYSPVVWQSLGTV
jgi:hypothetical protein